MENIKNELLVELISTQHKIITEDKIDDIHNAIINLNNSINKVISKYNIINNSKLINKEKKNIPGW